MNIKELEALIETGTAAAKQMRNQDNLIAAIATEKRVAELINELTARHIAALEN